MRTVFVVALASCMAWAVGEYTVVDPSASPIATPGYMISIELSRDNGNIASAWTSINGAGIYVGDQYDVPSGGWSLQQIKYYVWSQGWPDNIYQGFSVACWKMESGTPSDLIWPDDGNPRYNPNTGGNWITQNTDGWPWLHLVAPDGFVVGIEFMYNYPASDGFGVDNTGVGPYDWSNVLGTWSAAPYGKGSARVLLGPWMSVETATLGSLRALYH